MEPIHIFFLIIGLSGQPAGVIRSTAIFSDVKVCEAALPQAMIDLQAKFDTSDNPAIKGRFAVADAICKTTRDMGGEPERGA